MRFAALIPVALCATSLVLAFLCLFAGSSKGFLEDYAILTLNTSRIGQNIFNTSESSSSLIGQLIDNVTNSIESDIQDLVTSTAQDLGLHDFYSAHLMKYCEGYYEPGPVPNATLKKSEISKNVTQCSNSTTMYHFDPQQILEKELNESGLGVDLSDLNWPDGIQVGIDALNITSKAMFVLYCIAIGFIGIAFLLAAASFFFEGRLSALVNVVTDWLAFVILGIASALATAIGVKACDVINKYEDDTGVSATKGKNFLIITWVATGLLLLSSMVWCVDCVVGRRHRTTSRSTLPKHG